MELGSIVFTPKGKGIVIGIEDGIANVRLDNGCIFEFNLSEIGMFYDDTDKVQQGY